MRQLRFPDCVFLQKLDKIVSEGEEVNSRIGKLLDLCDWGYELTQEYGEKMTLQEFDSICDSIKLSPVNFEPEMIEINIIKAKYE